jgi:putative transposase
LLTPHPDYQALGRDPDERRRVYRQWAMATPDLDEVATIRHHTRSQHAYGSDTFRETVEATLGRSAGPQKLGRPRSFAAA